MAFLSGYGKRKELRYGTAFPDANLTDFPKLFTIAGDSDIAAELASGGGIAVTEADGETPVPFGLYPSSDPTSGDLILRAKFDLLTAATTGDVIGYLYYDSTASTTEDKEGVVSNGYVLFMPLEEDPSGVDPQMYDWVSESKVGTSAGSMTSGDLVAGQVGNGLDFDGSNDVISVPLVMPSTFTIEAAVARRTAGGAAVGRIVETNGSTSISVFSTGVEWPTFVLGGVLLVRSATPTADWTQFALRFESGATNGKRIFENGVSVAQATQTASPNGTTLYIGNRAAANRTWDGIIDEVRVSSVARSDDWLAYAYADDFANADTFSLGPEEVDGGGPATFNPAWAIRSNILIGV